MKRSIFILSILFSLSASANTYYCSPTGTGDGLSYTSPSSLSTGLSYLQNAGDTLYLLGGQYDVGNTRVKCSGSPSANIVISGYPGELAILDFRTVSYGTRGLQIDNACQYVHVKDLTLRYSGKNNLYNEGSYCRFENLDIYGSADTGCQMKKGGNNLIINVDSHDNFDYKLDKSGNLTLCDFGGNADGFADKQFSGPGNHYIGCRSWNNSDDGWDFFQRESTSETIIENCICYQNGPAEYDMRNHPRYQTDKAWFDQFATPLQVIDADSIPYTVSLEHYKNWGNGNGFKIGGSYTTHNVTVHHCLAIANTVKGFDQNSNFGTMYFYNCTGYDNGQDFGFYNTNGGTLYLRNCVSYQSRSANTYSVQNVAANDHNSWNISGLSVRATDFISMDTTHILDARVSDGDYPSVVYALFAPSVGSCLIDRGVNVGLPYGGSAPDLGWQETGTVKMPAVVKCTSANLHQTLIEGQAITPIVFAWDGAATGLTISPSLTGTGLSSSVNSNQQTLTISGTPNATGQYSFTVSTTAVDAALDSLIFTIKVKSVNAHQIAFITVPNSSEDDPILEVLNAFDSLAVTVIDASQIGIDYSPYHLIVVSPKPTSSAAGIAAIKGINKPVLLLKPWVFKPGVWDWGTAVNTSDEDLQLASMDTSHPLFSYLFADGDNTTDGLPLIHMFSKVNTNGITGITSTSWKSCPDRQVLATDMANKLDVITYFPAASNCNGITLTQPLLAVGISEYSTAYLTHDGQQLIANAAFWMLGLQPQAFQEEQHPETSIHYTEAPAARKVMIDGHIYIIREGQIYSITGNRIQ